MARRRVSIGRGAGEAPRAGAAPGPLPTWAPDEEAPRGPGRARRIVRALALVLLIVVGGYTALAVALHVLLDPDDLAGWLEPRLSGALNRPVEIGGATVVLVPRPGVRLSEVVVASPEGFDGPPVAELVEAQLHLAVLPLFLGRARVSAVHLAGPAVHLAVDEEGRTNFGDLVPESAVSGDGPAVGPVRLALRRLTAEGGALRYTDASEARTIGVTGAGMDGTIETDGAGGWVLVAGLRSDSAFYRTDPGADGGVERDIRTVGPGGSLTIRGRAGADAVEIEQGSLEHAGAILEVRGRLSGLLDSSPALAVELTNDTLSASVLPRVLGRGRPAADAPEFGGELGVSIQLEAPGTREGEPVLRTRVALRDVAIRRARTIVASGLDGTITTGHGTMEIDSLSGTFADGPLLVTGVVTGPDRWLEAHVSARMDLDVLDRAGWAPSGMAVSGGLALEAAITGSLDLPEGIGASGTGTLDGLRLDHERWEVPVYLPAGELRLLPRGFAWEQLVAMVGEDRLVTSGTVENLSVLGLATEGRPRIDAEVRAPNLRLDALLPPTPERRRVPWARVAFAHAGGGRLDDRTTDELAREMGLARPDAAPLEGAVQIIADSLRYGDYALEAVSAELMLSDTLLAVRDASFRTWGGEVRGSLELGVGDDLLEPFSLSMSTQGVDALPFLSRLTPFGEAVSGILDLDVTLSGAVDRRLLPATGELRGSGEMVVTDGRIAESGVNLALADFLSSESWTEVPFASWETAWSLEQDVVAVERARLEGPLGAVRFAGPVRLDGGVDLELTLSIPAAALEGVSLRRTGIGDDALARLRASGTPLDLGLRMGGTLAGPTLEPDASVRLFDASRGR